MAAYLAIDLGAGSGRLVRGVLENGIMIQEEIARFPNEMIESEGRVYWNLDGLFSEIKHALSAMPKAERPDSIGVDSWGVDFVLLDAEGNPTGRPVAYRDSRTNGKLEEFLERVPRERVYEKTGIQFMPINTLIQLFAMSKAKSPELEAAEDLLFIPDYFNYRLTGERISEYTIATTSQIFNIHEAAWDHDLIRAAGVKPGLFQKIIRPGTAIGRLSKDVQKQTGLGAIPVVAVASHDTGSAVAAAPAAGEDWAYISSGTWSLMGVESALPILSDKAINTNFTNEGGVSNTIRFLKNIMGLWPIQRIYSETNGKYSFGDLARLASDSPAFQSLIDVDDPRFHNPDSMREAIAGYCRETVQPVPETPGALVRCCLESLALQYRMVLGELREITGRTVNRIHVVGGGSRNELLNRMTANAAQLPVAAGPAEAASLGNMLVQAMALGHINSLTEARSIAAASAEIHEFVPEDPAAWAAAYDVYMRYKMN